MERILANPLFKHSKRCPGLLRYVIERSLEGRSVHLKERTLGVEVFGRDPDYDTNLDPIVRATAGEIRKRIAQYYHEPGHEHEIRIDLPSGSYVAEFTSPRVLEVLPPAELGSVAQVDARRTRFLIGLVIAILLPALVVAVVLLKPLTALDRFWAPVLNSSAPVLLCIGGPRALASTPAPDSQTGKPATEISVSDRMKLDIVAFADATTLSRLAGLLQARGKNYHIRRGASTTLSDMREGPAVLIGGFNNDWTMRVTSQLRFIFEKDPVTRQCQIRDRQNPASFWAIDAHLPYMNLTEDYALISRVWDPTTERPVVVAAGIVNYGTVAAGEFLTDPTYMEEIIRHAPRHWEQRNIQIVIATKVINGNSGPPRVVATQFW
jgi:hypothetical protein